MFCELLVPHYHLSLCVYSPSQPAGANQMFLEIALLEMQRPQ